MPKGARALNPSPLQHASDLLVVATKQGRLLIFPATELPSLAKGKGNKLIHIPAADLTSGVDNVVAVVTLPESGALRILSGKRHVTLKAIDIAHYSGSRAKRGMVLPRGFQRVDGLSVEE